MNYSTEIKLIACQSKSGTKEIRSSNDVKSLLRLIERLAHKILQQRQGRSLFPTEVDRISSRVLSVSHSAVIALLEWRDSPADH
ncbi:hypothetical protein CEXT_216881 [Caerostris extrusa]|uniref:Uncharacterized protein n=1 Tax=Caerostris extrusa TaxID=172846 RepID=A0AAV4XTQ6_CAEEX|nr:hypothetical protein CEXT_216881 [Caerostris extrusa]